VVPQSGRHSQEVLTDEISAIEGTPLNTKVVVRTKSSLVRGTLPISPCYALPSHPPNINNFTSLHIAFNAQRRSIYNTVTHTATRHQYGFVVLVVVTNPSIDLSRLTIKVAV
jgi:hypothetical protein